MTALDWIAFALAVPLGFLALCVACVLVMALRDMGPGPHDGASK